MIVEVRASLTQTGHEAIEAVAAAAGLPTAQCDVRKLHLGGGFGRRRFSD
jgi:isoquinoline 1-oxidoreductase beta subunit